ncbi:hypothetical protein, partial [Faecalispora jeddahensis]
MNRLLKLTAAFLSAVILMQSFTSVALAAEAPQEQNGAISINDQVQEAGIPENPDTTFENAQIITEYPEKRTETSKTFFMSDGTFLTASYREPIHYQ